MTIDTNTNIEIEMVKKQIENIYNILKIFFNISKEDIDEMIKTNNVNVVQKSIDSLNSNLKEELRKVF